MASFLILLIWRAVSVYNLVTAPAFIPFALSSAILEQMAAGVKGDLTMSP
jgi:hypothetical protein